MIYEMIFLFPSILVKYRGAFTRQRLLVYTQSQRWLCCIADRGRMFMSGIVRYAVGLFANTMLGDWTESHIGASLGHFKPQLLMNTTFNIKFSISGIKFPEKRKY